MSRTDRIDLVDLGQPSPFLAFEVVRTGRVLYRRDPDLGNALELRVLGHYRDAVVRLRQLQALRKELPCGRPWESVLASLAESVERLARHGVISEELRRGFQGSGGFRNVLVHEYARVDLRRVAETAGRTPGLFRSFAAQVRAWPDAHGQG